MLAYAARRPTVGGLPQNSRHRNGAVGRGDRDLRHLKTALQSVIPLRVILDRIADFEGEPRWQAPFLRLLTSIYLSEAVLHREVKTSRDLEKRLLNIMKALPYEKDATLACFGALPAINM